MLINSLVKYWDEIVSKIFMYISDNISDFKRFIYLFHIWFQMQKKVLNNKTCKLIIF